MTRPVALAAALLVLSACDSTGPDDVGTDDPIVGTWTVATSTYDEVATVSRTQSVLDARSPVESTVTVRGSETGDLRAVGYVGRYSDGLDFALLSYDPQGPYPARPLALTVSDRPDFPGMTLSVQGEDYATYYATANEGLFTRSDWSYTFRDTPLTSGDRSVTVSGTVRFGSRTLAADRPTVLNQSSTLHSSSYVLTYTFERDGTFVVREGNGNQTVERAGTWTREGGRLVMRRPVELGDGVLRTEFAVDLEDGALVLTNDRTGQECVGGCLQYAELTYGLEAGTLQRLEYRFTSRFTRGAAATARTGLTPGVPMPQALREWLLLGPDR